MDTKEEIDDSGNKKYVHNGSHKLNLYNKRIILKYLVENGCDLNSCKYLEEKFRKIAPGEIKKFVDSCAKSSQEHAGDDCDSNVFHSLNQWAANFKAKGFSEKCGYELPLAFKGIAELESFPECLTDDDIDFRKLYMTMSRLTMGYPVSELNGATRKFLTETFTELIENVYKSTNKMDLEPLKTALTSNKMIFTIGEDKIEPIAKNLESHGFDPLQLEEKTLLGFQFIKTEQ